MKIVSFIKQTLSLSLLLLACTYLLLPNKGVTTGVLIVKAASIEEEQEIKLNVNSISLIKGETFSLKVYNTNDKQKITFRSSSSSVASVSKEGLITAKKKGNAKVTVTVKEGFKTVATIKCTITVGLSAVTVKFAQPNSQMRVNDKITLITFIKPSETVETPIYSSDNPDVVSVTSNGTITAKSVGSAYIFATIGNGSYDSCLVTVTDDR